MIASGYRYGPAYRAPRTTNSNRWMPFQPIASWTTPCSSCNDMDSGTKTRRQTIGLNPSSRTLSCRIAPGSTVGFTDSVTANYALLGGSIKIDPMDFDIFHNELRGKSVLFNGHVPLARAAHGWFAGRDLRWRTSACPREASDRVWHTRELQGKTCTSFPLRYCKKITRAIHLLNCGRFSYDGLEGGTLGRCSGDCASFFVQSIGSIYCFLSRSLTLSSSCLPKPG